MNGSRYLFCTGLLFATVSYSRCATLLAADSAAVGPEISLSLRGVADAIIAQGEPLRIAVRLDAPREADGAIELAPASGTWSDAITVEILPAVGGPAVARAETIGKPEMPNATVSASQVAGGLWRVSAESMRRVAPGSYVVRARLAIPTGAGWNGEVISEELPVQVVAGSESDDRVVQRVINQAHDALISGRIEEAAAIVDRMLERAPDDKNLLIVRAEIAYRAGNPHAATICLNRFLLSWTEMGPGQPPVELEELRTRIMNALLADNPPPANPPAWSWPPKAVMARQFENPPPSAAPAVVSDAPTNTATAADPVSVTVTAVAGVKPAQDHSPAAPMASSPGLASNGRVLPSAEQNDAAILADPAGQWAAGANASSQYGSPKYGAEQAVGAPNIPLGLAGDNPEAWCPASKNEGMAWVELTFPRPVHATEVRVRQNNAPGAIAKVEAISPDGKAHLWWEGVDPYVEPRVREIAWFALRVPKTEYLVDKVRVTLKLDTVPGWKQIDAVQLVGTPE